MSLPGMGTCDVCGHEQVGYAHPRPDTLVCPGCLPLLAPRASDALLWVRKRGRAYWHLARVDQGQALCGGWVVDDREESTVVPGDQACPVCRSRRDARATPITRDMPLGPEHRAALDAPPQQHPVAALLGPEWRLLYDGSRDTYVVLRRDGLHTEVDAGHWWALGPGEAAAVAGALNGSELTGRVVLECSREQCRVVPW